MTQILHLFKDVVDIKSEHFLNSDTLNPEFLNWVVLFSTESLANLTWRACGVTPGCGGEGEAPPSSPLVSPPLSSVIITAWSLKQIASHFIKDLLS